MRKFRCPWCGEESFTTIFSKLMTARGVHYTKAFVKCPNCAAKCNRFVPQQRTTIQKIMDTITILMGVIMLICFVLSLVLKAYFLIPISILCLIIGYFLLEVPRYYTDDLTRYDFDEDKSIEFQTDIIAFLRFDDDIKRVNKLFLRSGATLSIHFDSKENQDSYTVFFKRVIHTDSGKLQAEMSFLKPHIIKRENILPESKLEVFDNGIKIAKGQIEKILV